MDAITLCTAVIVAVLVYVVGLVIVELFIMPAKEGTKNERK